MKKLLVISGLLLTISTAFATDGDQMLGVTANQWLRGGAIVASPTDMPSMIYNPAALGVLKINKYGFDLSLGIMNPPRSITNPMGKKTDSESNYYLGMGNGFAVKISDKIFFGVAAGGVSGMGVDFPSGTLPDNPATPFSEAASIVTKKGLLKIVPTFAYKPTENLSIGVSLQIGQQSLALKSPAFMMPQTEEWGFGAAVGAIYRFSEKLQAGISYVSKMNISEYEFNGYSPIPTTTGEGIYKMTMNSPQSFAFGLSFKPLPSLLVEGDVKWYNFSDVMDYTELKSSNGAVLPLAFGWDDQIVYALGIDYAVNECLSVKFGYNYGATPIGEDDVDSNFGSIAVVEHHFSIGATKYWNENVFSTLSYTRGLHNELKSSVTGNVIEAEQNIIFVQLGLRF